MYFDAIDMNTIAYRVYDRNQVVMGKTMEQHLRPALCWWHTLCWQGEDAFGGPVFDRAWLQADSPMQRAMAKLDAGFELIQKLQLPYFTFHDIDLAPEGATLKESLANLQHMVDATQEKMQQTGIKLLWGTANLFSHKRFMAGAATNPNPEVFAYACAKVKAAMDATAALDGANYVLWGGREGYDTLLNTELTKESDQLGRFLTLVAEYKHRIGYKGALLIEPKPCEPTKHQYDFDCGHVYAFLQKYGLEKEFQVNIEANHATLAGHSFEHEVAYACAHNIMGSIDANRGDPQLGWDTDQFPIDVTTSALVIYEILRHGGFTTGGFNFDAKLRRQSIDLEDFIYAFVAGMDTLAQGLLIAEKMLTDDVLQQFKMDRYAAWNHGLGQSILNADMNLAELADCALRENYDPQPVSGRQEMLERYVNSLI